MYATYTNQCHKCALLTLPCILHPHGSDLVCDHCCYCVLPEGGLDLDGCSLSLHCYEVTLPLHSSPPVGGNRRDCLVSLLLSTIQPTSPARGCTRHYFSKQKYPERQSVSAQSTHLCPLYAAWMHVAAKSRIVSLERAPTLVSSSAHLGWLYSTARSSAVYLEGEALAVHIGETISYNTLHMSNLDCIAICQVS